MEVQQVMSALEKFDSKLDDIKTAVHAIDVKVVGNMAATGAHEKEIESLKKTVRELQASHDKAQGVLKLLSLPGVIGFLYAMVEVLKH